MNPYRENAAPTAPRLTRLQRVGLWFCRHGWHAVEETILRGGAGPDDAAAYLTCRRCGVDGIRWCDGSIEWDG